MYLRMNSDVLMLSQLNFTGSLILNHDNMRIKLAYKVVTNLKYLKVKVNLRYILDPDHRIFLNNLNCLFYFVLKKYVVGPFP